MAKFQTVIPVAVSLMLAVQSSCSKDDKKETEEDDSTTAAVGGTGTSSTKSISSASNVGDLQLKDALTITLPEALAGSSGSGLRLTAALKSQESCQMGETVREVTDSLGEIGGFFCHMEVEKDKIIFGKKYLIRTGGQEFARLYVDNSDIANGKITVGFCSQHGADEKNKQLIVLSGLSDAGPKGQVFNEGTYSLEDGTASSWKSAVTFDMSTSGTVNISSNQRYASGDNIFTRAVELALKSAGISNISLAAKGSWQGNAFLERGAALFDGSFGSAIFQNQGSHEGQTFSFARRAYFNQAGEVLEKAGVPTTVIPEATALPAFLATDFVPASASGWVGEGCPDYDEALDLNVDSAEHQACERNHDNSMSSCWDQSTHQSGTENVTIAE